MIDRIKAALSSPKLNEFISNRINQWIILGTLVLIWMCMVGSFIVFVNATAGEDTTALAQPTPGMGASAAAQLPTAVEQVVIAQAPSAVPKPGGFRCPAKSPS